MIVFRRKRRNKAGKLVVAKTYTARHRFAGESKFRELPLKVSRKDVAEKLGREWVDREERKLAGLLVDSIEIETADTPLDELVEEFGGSLRARGGRADYVRKPPQRCRDLFAALGWRRVADANPLQLRRHLERSNWTPCTRNHYLTAVKQLFKWMQRDGRIPRNPIEAVPHFDASNTESFDRAALTEDEIRRLVDPETGDPKRLYRADVYALMVFSGLRWAEADRLQVRDVREDEDGLSILIPRGKDKAKRGDVIELPDELVPVLERLTFSRNPEDRLLHMGCPTRRSFRLDCERAGIPSERADGSRIVRYSTRDTYTSLLRSRARSTDQLRALTRHTTRGMEDRYTDRKTQGLRELVNKLPVVVPTRPAEVSNDRGPDVPADVHPPTHADASTILRGFDSPRLHFWTHWDTPGLDGSKLL